MHRTVHKMKQVHIKWAEIIELRDVKAEIKLMRWKTKPKYNVQTHASI